MRLEIPTLTEAQAVAGDLVLGEVTGSSLWAVSWVGEVAAACIRSDQKMMSI